MTTARKVATVGAEQKVVVITGIGRTGQLGERVAQAFAKEGARVIVVDRLAEEANARASELRTAGFDAHPLACDLTDEAQVATLTTNVRTLSNGRIDALINVAGGFAMSGPVGESDFAVSQRMFAINLTTAYLATRAFLPFLRPAKGSIVYFTSVAALPGGKVAQMAAYAAAKSGVITLMRAVAAEEAANGVRANAIAPTAIRTADNLKSMGDNVRYVERDEIAATAIWLCSEEASAVTGQVIPLGH